MRFTPQEINAAFEALDCVGLPVAMKLKADVERIARQATRGSGRRASTAAPSKPWPREDAAIMFVLWKKFDAYLEHVMRRHQRNASIH